MGGLPPRPGAVLLTPAAMPRDVPCSIMPAPAGGSYMQQTTTLRHSPLQMQQATSALRQVAPALNAKVGKNLPDSRAVAGANSGHDCKRATVQLHAACGTASADKASERRAVNLLKACHTTTSVDRQI
jgi:hypothetical protein